MAIVKAMAMAMAIVKAMTMALVRYGDNPVGQSVQYAPLLPASQQELVAQDFMMHHNTNMNPGTDTTTHEHTLHHSVFIVHLGPDHYITLHCVYDTVCLHYITSQCVYDASGPNHSSDLLLTIDELLDPVALSLGLGVQIQAQIQIQMPAQIQI